MEQIKVRNVIGDPIKFTIGDGVSIDEIIKASEIPEQLLPQIVVLNHGLMIKEWSYITHPGDQLTICVRPTGGGGGGAVKTFWPRLQPLLWWLLPLHWLLLLAAHHFG